MDRREAAALDHYLTTQPEQPDDPSEMAADEYTESPEIHNRVMEIAHAITVQPTLTPIAIGNVVSDLIHSAFMAGADWGWREHINEMQIEEAQQAQAEAEQREHDEMIANDPSIPLF
jgi:hypothetical protein